MPRAALFLLLFLTQALAAAGPEGPFLSLPAQGLIDTEEGSIEFWVQFAFDPLEPHESYRGRGCLLAVLFGDAAFKSDGITISVGTRDAGRRTPNGRDTVARFGVISEGQDLRHPVLASFGHDARRDHWRHFAAAWRGRELWVYIDGRSVSPAGQAAMVYERPLRAVLTPEARLCLGGWPQPWHPPNFLAIDELRISSVARSPADLALTAPAAPDAHTLFLMRFDSAEGNALRSDYAATPAAAAPLSLPKGFGLIPGRFGRALAFNTAAFAPRTP